MTEGWGLFETMRSYNGNIVCLDRHLKRLESSAELIGMDVPASFKKIKAVIKNKVKIKGFKDARVRLVLWNSGKQADISVSVDKYQPYPGNKYRRGFSSKVSDLRQGEFNLLARIKTTNRIFYDLSLREAVDLGFDEAIILNNRGQICEATRSNIFFAKDNELFTPAIACGCLDGITRLVVIGLARKYKIKTCEGRFTLQDLYKADESFLTNSLMGIMPLTHIEKKPLGSAKCGKMTGFFMKKYSCLLKNGTNQDKITF